MSRLPSQLNPVVDFDLLDLALDGAERETQMPPPDGVGGCYWLPRHGGMMPASWEGWRGRARGLNSGVVDNHIFIGN